MLGGQSPYISEFTSSSLHHSLGGSSCSLNATQSGSYHDIPQVQVDIASPPPPALRVHRKYSSVTLPVSVVFAVNGRAPNRQSQLSFVQPSRRSTGDSSTMARPRSPQKKHHGSQDLSHKAEESQLDKTLVAIREKLNILSTERLQLEHQMESLTSGIKEACVQCRRMSSRSSISSVSSSSLRRVRSIGEAEVCSITPRVPKRSSLPQEEVDGIVSDDAWSIRTRSSTTSNSRESFKESPELSRSRLESGFLSSSIVSSLSQSSVFTSSLSSSLPHNLHSDVTVSPVAPKERERSESCAASTVNRLSTANLDVFIDDWFSAAVIPELPESPKSVTPTKPLFTSRDLAPSPFSYSRQHSTPDLADKRKFYTSPRLRKARGSLPENFINKVNSSNDSLSSSENLSQGGPYTDQVSPKVTGSTTIIRRSSLTGQLEHVRRPRVLVKRTSSFNLSTSSMSESNLASAGSYGSIGSPRSIRGRSKSPRPLRSYCQQTSVILPSIETCV